MQLETINKLFLELSQFATAKTQRELELEAIIKNQVMPDKVLRVIEAAKFCNYCPDAGGYRDGRSVEDCYEELSAALNDYYGVHIDTPVSIWITEEELEAHINANN
jgi:hypothetical protein